MLFDLKITQDQPRRRALALRLHSSILCVRATALTVLLPPPVRCWKGIARRRPCPSGKWVKQKFARAAVIMSRKCGGWWWKLFRVKRPGPIAVP